MVINLWRRMPLEIGPSSANNLFGSSSACVQRIHIGSVECYEKLRPYAYVNGCEYGLKLERLTEASQPFGERIHDRCDELSAVKSILYRDTASIGLPYSKPGLIQPGKATFTLPIMERPLRISHDTSFMYRVRQPRKMSC